MKHCFYFAPHQDDELLNFGAAIRRDLAGGRRVVVVLCTDGAASGVKRCLSDGKACHLHEGRHLYPLSATAFTAARDREFTESCRRMGVAATGVCISPLRQPDGALTEAQAREIMLAATAGLPPAKIAVRALAETAEQNPDHRATARAALSLYREGAFGELRRYCEIIRLDSPGYGRETLRRVEAEEEDRKRLFDAADAYGIWDPTRGFYAVGIHSVADEFLALRADPAVWEVPENDSPNSVFKRIKT